MILFLSCPNILSSVPDGYIKGASCGLRRKARSTKEGDFFKMMYNMAATLQFVILKFDRFQAGGAVQEGQNPERRRGAQCASSIQPADGGSVWGLWFWSRKWPHRQGRDQPCHAHSVWGQLGDREQGGWWVGKTRHPANERWFYILTPSFIGWAHTQNDPWINLSPFFWVLLRMFHG